MNGGLADVDAFVGIRGLKMNGVLADAIVADVADAVVAHAEAEGATAAIDVITVSTLHTMLLVMSRYGGMWMNNERQRANRCNH